MPEEYGVWQVGYTNLPTTVFVHEYDNTYISYDLCVIVAIRKFIRQYTPRRIIDMETGEVYYCPELGILL